MKWGLKLFSLSLLTGKCIAVFSGRILQPVNVDNDHSGETSIERTGRGTRVFHTHTDGHKYLGMRGTVDLNSERTPWELKLGVKDFSILMRKNCFLRAVAQLETRKSQHWWEEMALLKMEVKLPSALHSSASTIHLLFPWLVDNLAAPSLLRDIGHTSESDPHFLWAHLAPSWGPSEGQKMSTNPKHCLHKQDKPQYQDWLRTTFLSRIHCGDFKLANHYHISLSVLPWSTLAVQLVKFPLLLHLLSCVTNLFFKCILNWLWATLGNTTLDSAEKMKDECAISIFFIYQTAVELFPIHHLLLYFNKLLLKRMLVVTTKIIDDIKNH